jgi:methylmalonyl-CoA/ethylmalonyl-CoA epimerase
MPPTSRATITLPPPHHIAIAVINLEGAIDSYRNMLGIDAWELIDVKPPILHNQIYLGKPADFTYKLGLVKIGPIQLELVQPVSGENAYSDFIAKHGEGLHHIGYTVDDIQETTLRMNERGFPTIMSGGFVDGGFAYYDTVGPLKCILEAYQVPKVMPPIYRYP